MTHRILSAASFIVSVALAAPSYAAEPQFNAGLVTESRTYQREELRKGQTPSAASRRLRTGDPIVVALASSGALNKPPHPVRCEPS